MIDLGCSCLTAPLPYDHYAQVRFVGVDEAEGRFGEVSVWRCKRCGRHWLRYLLEYEHLPESGRYFMGLITPEAAEALKPDAAIRHLDSLEWHLYGGSYFRGQGRAAGKASPFA
jgi:hypothetical protein